MAIPQLAKIVLYDCSTINATGDFFMQQDYDNGKYTVIFDEKTGAMHALRNGEAWQDLSGNKLVYWMLVEHKRALEQRAELLEALKRLACMPDWEEIDAVRAIANEAITKADAAE